jgi:nitrogen fixation/metabolism regulation signal transduction histidine kinase
LNTPAPTRSRRRRLLLLGAGIALLVFLIFSQAAFNLKFLRPESLVQTFVFAALSALIFLALVALIFVLLRTLLKLYLERQAGTAGSRFRSKMVLGALVLSFGPVIAMFLFAYGLMNRSIDKWFSQPIEEVHGRNAAVTDLLSSYAGQNALAEARSIAANPEALKAYHTGKFGALMEEFREHEMTLQGGFALAFYKGQIEASFGSPVPWGVMLATVPNLATMQGKPQQFTLDNREYMLGTAPVEGMGHVAVALPLPEDYSNALHQLEQSEQRYQELRRNNKLIRQTYMQALLLITLLVLFGTTWSALALSKLVTRPVTALAEGTQAISAGKLDYRVEVSAGDELGQLVGSFNSMAAELESNRRQLQEANVRLEERRLHMETILESIPSGVLSLDGSGQVTRVNAALIRMFDPKGVSQPGTQTGLRLTDLFPADSAPDVADDIRRLTRKADRMGTTTSQMEIPNGGTALEVGVTVASMAGARQLRRRVLGGDGPPVADARRLGYVIVFEDLSDLLKAQKQAAWREVARRVAHEIKNPLTPIALSAERIKRHIERGIRGESASQAVIESCADTIGSAVETVRKLVDEFSTLARFPPSQPQAADLNQIILSAMALFEGRLTDVTVKLELADDLPRVMADPEAIKRVVANLVDNAAESLKDSVVREIRVATSLLETRDGVEIEVSDTGGGVTAETKERLFLPYFSTKARGTGLGLAIVARILEDHGGTIRVEENHPVGSRFLVELPVAGGSERTAAEQTTDLESTVPHLIRKERGEAGAPDGTDEAPGSAAASTDKTRGKG